MIFVTVGSAIGGGEFNRLIKEVDRIALSLEHEILIQIGASEYTPRNAKWFKFVDYEKILECFKEADLVIAHCGTGSVINALSAGSRLIVVPRRAHFGEHSDDHQMEMAMFLQKSGLAKVVYDVEKLEDEIRLVLNQGSKKVNGSASEGREALIKNLRGYLRTIHE